MAIQTHAKIPVLDFSSEDLKQAWYRFMVLNAQTSLPYLKSMVVLIHNKIFDAVGELFDFPTETKKKITYEKPFHGYASSALHERLVIEEEEFEICGHLY